jgi:hypothetical protein
MISQIQQAIDNLESLSNLDQEKFIAILQRYVSGEIGIEEAYYDLLDCDLIHMPQRCAMYAKPEKSARDEELLRNHINSRLFDK